MAHPFQKMFEAALKKSDHEDNLVLTKARELTEKGYRPGEIVEVLITLMRGRIDDRETAIIREALEEYREQFDED